VIGAALKLASANPVLAPWVEGARALWPIIWRAALFALVFYLGWRYGAAHERDAIADERVAQAEAMVKGMEAVRAEQAAAEARSEKVETAYEESKKELADVRRDIPARVVRLCVAASRQRDVPGVSAPASVDDGRPGDQADVQGEAGPDLGPELYALADECDDNARRLGALQGWVSSVPGRGKATSD
jgi:hypothetical protein